MHIAYSECVFVDLGIHHAMRVRHGVIYGLSGCTIFLHIISQTARSSKKKKVPNKKYVLISPQHSSETFLIPRKTQRDIIIYVHRSYVTYRLLLLYFNENWIF